MKNHRWMFIAFAVVPGAIAAILCAIAFAQYLSLYLSMPSPPIQSVVSGFNGMNFGAPDTAKIFSTAQGIAEVAGKTLLRFNCFLSGAGLLLSLILLTLGLQGLRASQREKTI